MSAVTYGAAWQLVTVSGLYTEVWDYDERLRLKVVNDATFGYKPNGRIETETVGGETITHQYDSLNRLISSSSNQGWSQGYNYDGYGNLTAKTGVNAPTFTAGYDLNNHQIGFSYDANGNQTLDLQGVSARYDVENRIAWVVKNGTALGNG